MAKNKIKKNLPALPTSINLGKQLEQQMTGKTNKSLVTDSKTTDSFANLAGRLGIQNGHNLISHSRYDLGPFISRDRLQLEAMYRSSWLVGQVVDTVAEDMTRDGITMNSEMSPDDIQELQVAIGEFGIWQDLCATIKWGRLYGGAIAVILIDGADYEKPLDIEKVRKDQFKGLIVLDRWMIQPSLGELITDIGKDMGNPMYYEVLSGVNTFPSAKIHYSRVIRIEGIELPYYQKMFENFWGLSVVERMLDRLIAFDSASEGAAQLLYKLHLRVIKIKGFREALANGGKEEEAVIKQFKYIRLMQSNEGLTLLDADDEFQTHQFGGLRGMADMLDTFGQQISGSTNIPLVRLFGQSPAGFSNGETDLRNYYDLVRKLQENQLREGLHKLLAVIAKSRLNKHLPDDFTFTFNALWQISEMEKSQIASQDAQTQTTLYGGGLITKVTALKEIRQQSAVTGRGTNITDDDIKDAENEPPLSELMGGMGEAPGSEPSGNAEAPEAENPNERMGGENPDVAEGENNPEEENPIVKDSVKKKIKFRDKLNKIMPESIKIILGIEGE
jgi:phage-related protein (TIGR01555 family)